MLCSMATRPTKDTVWNKGKVILGKDCAKYRQDSHGNEIHYDDYGNTKSIFGWEIHHKIPISCDGKDTLTNTEPLQWNVNRQIGGCKPVINTHQMLKPKPQKKITTNAMKKSKKKKRAKK
jgi:hypothetical protein